MNILNKSLSELKIALSTDFLRGLSKKSVKENTDAFGLNLPFGDKENVLSSFFKSLLSDVMPWLFVGICILSSFYKSEASLTCSIVLFFIYILIRMCIYLYIKNIDNKISDYRKIEVTVIRSCKKQVINAVELVPGDILFLKAGDFVPCDCIIIESNSLNVYESFITSTPYTVLKKPQSELNQTDAYHSCLVFAGSAVADGTAKVLVCHTAKNIFNIQNSPLKKVFSNQMPKIHQNNVFAGKQIYLLWILMCFVVFTIGILMKYNVFNMFFISVTLSIAALGDCIPLLSEVAIMTGVARLYKQNGCVLKNYRAIDTFNSTDTVFIENFSHFLSSMPKIKSFFIGNNFYTPQDVNEHDRDQLIKYSIVSMMSTPDTKNYIDISLKKFAKSLGITLKSLGEEFVYLNSYSGEIDAVLAFINGEYSVISRGFAYDMLSRCTTIKVNDSIREIGRNERLTLQNHIRSMELDSQTVIAVVKKQIDFSQHSTDCFIDLDRMTLLGFIGFYNPISTEAVKSLELCKKSNINTVLMANAPQGAYIDIAKSTALYHDQDLTADAVSLSRIDPGLLRAELKRYKIFSNLSQQQRLYIAQLYKKNNSIVTSIPATLDDVPLQSASDASVTVFDKKLPAINHFSDALLLNKNFSVFASIVKHSRAIYHNSNKMLLYILTNQFLICTLMLAGMIVEKQLLFQPSVLLLYGIFSILPSALAISSEPPAIQNPLAPPNYNRFMFKFLSLIPHPFIVGFCGGIVTVMIHRIYFATPQIATSASLITLFATSFFIAISMSSDDFFFNRKISHVFWLSLAISTFVLAIMFIFPPLRKLFSLSLVNPEVILISLIFSLLPFAVSEIIKKAKNLTK